MRISLFLVLALAVAIPVSDARAEDVILNGCKVSATAPSVGDTSSDTDCKWGAAQLLKMQCDGAVYYSRDGSTPTADYPKVAVGDPYPIWTVANASGTVQPIKFLPVTGTVTCNFFIDRGARR